MTEQHGVTQSDRGVASLTLDNLATVVSDLDIAIEWYDRVLGFHLEARAENERGEVAFLCGAGTRLELLTASNMAQPQVRLEPLFADPPGHVLPIGNKFLVFQVDDVAQASAELAEKGVTFVWREEEAVIGIVASAIRDFDGNLISLVQRP
jgi:catechol 2,3-dioxygenase-like lactoylglutathione lyase family enzyme